MKVTTERLPKSLIALDIELEPQQVQKGLERAARKLSQDFRIPGFRPGKAPRQIVENYFGRERLLQEASDDLIQKTYRDALQQENIQPVGQIQLENVEPEPFRYRLLVPVEPTVDVADYSNYRLPYEPEPVTDETVQKLLDAQREQHVVLKELEEARPAQDGDMVTVLVSSDDDADDEDEDDEDDGEDVASVELDDEDEIEADDEDEVDDDEDEVGDEDDLTEAAQLEGDADETDETEDETAEGQEQQIALVPGRIRPEFYDALVGAQAGDTRTVTVQYSDDEEDESLRGQQVTYTLKVKNVQERLLPDWEELPTLTEFEGDFAALQTSARERLETASEDKARRALIDSFLDRVSEETQFELPEAMIQERATELFHQQVSEFQRYGISEDQFLKLSNKTHEQAVAEFTDQAEKDVRRSVLVREIVRREGLTLNDQEIATERERFLADFGPDRREEVQQMLDQPNMQQMVASAALDRKLRERLVAIATGAELPARGEEASMDRDQTASSGESTTPAVLSDVASGGVTENSVFEDVGAPEPETSGTSSVEQATVADYGQKDTADEQASDAESSRSSGA